MGKGFDILKARYILLIFLAYIASGSIISYFFTAIGMDYIFGFSDLLLNLTLLAVLFWALARYRIKAKNIFGRIPITGIWLTVVFLVIVVGMFSVAVAVFQEYFFPRNATNNDFYGLYNFSDPVSLVIGNISIVIIIPLIEELIFRGILIHRWSRKWSKRTAILLSSFVFGIGHIDPIGAFAFGVISSLLYIKTKSLWVSIGAHSLNNFLVSLVLISIVSTAPAIRENHALTGADLMFPGIMILITLPILIFYIKTNWPRGKLPYNINSGSK